MIKILIIEKQTIVAEGLRVLLEEDTEFQIFLSDSKDVKIDDLIPLKIDVVLISLDHMNESDFAYLDIFYKLNHNSHKSQFISPFKLIVYAEKVDQHILNKALQLDCQGYLLKDSSIEELKQAIRSVYNGYKHIGNSVFTKIDRLAIEQDAVNHKSPDIFLENDLVDSREYSNTDLVVAGNIKLNHKHNSINDQESKISTKQKLIDDKLSKNINPKNYSLATFTAKNSQSEKYILLRTIGSRLLLVGWGCMAGVIGVFLVKNRIANSFEPIVKHGTVQGEIVTIKNIHSGKIKILNYEVGDLVETKETVAKIESQSNKEKFKIIQEITKQIEKINKHIEHQKQLQVVNQSNLNRDRNKLEELLAQNLEFKSNKTFKQETLTFAAPSTLLAAQEEAKIAYDNYHQLQKLKNQQVVSPQEVERAKQAWKNSQNKFTKIQNNSQSQNLAAFLQREEQRNTVEQKNLQYIQENIERWQTLISEGENTIKLLGQDLNDARDRLNFLYDSYQGQQLMDVKAPVRGVISQIKINKNEVVNEDQTFMELVNCNNLWVEIFVNTYVLEKINIQQPVLLSLGTSDLQLSSKISSIYPVQNYRKSSSEKLLAQLSNSKDGLDKNSLNNKSLFKIKVDFPIPDQYAQDIMFCGWKETATVIFNN